MESFKTLARGKRLAIFLGYDGTLTPIVKDPDRAFMSDESRASVKLLASQVPTAIISGRCLEKVVGFVQLEELFYAVSAYTIATSIPRFGTP
ncbi:trehalose-phosphatase [Cymbomonas tetramitiformis]|uniref:Trehalose-phosphatase n=1 Tax=Cymbomonas tetramitiformis TaxID=36881 RepID=A0AAE0C2Z7_9CHLO|nr:trehalose-phosphatase [Cymbomonas tetramitiformis]KAK3247451.1 trehalose-phosphatase [Cymbomonas tetramitiformis]KAK3274010.1 trehalose-phosphatase [Cymbomonas tetramitiformis]KAK3275719.1 trehalose-phosphatase [Cymbomonas tetramitiformis]